MSDDFFRWVITIAVFLALTAFVVQVCLVFAMYRVTKVMQDKVMPVVDALTPIIGTVRRLVDENGPRVSAIISDAEHMMNTAREQVTRVGEVVKEFSDRARAQVARIDGAVDQTVEQVQNASVAMKDVVLKPVKQVDALVHGLRAAFSVMAHGRRESVDHATQDEEMFI
jgi:hypothetical protein